MRKDDFIFLFGDCLKFGQGNEVRVFRNVEFAFLLHHLETILLKGRLVHLELQRELPFLSDQFLKNSFQFYKPLIYILNPF